MVIAVFVGVWSTLPGPVTDPAMHIPAKETVALFQHITKTDATDIARSFPLIATVPLTDKPSVVVFLKTASGATGWAVLEPQEEGTSPFDVQVSDPQFTPLFQAIAHPLGRDYTYSVLRGESTDGFSAYVRFPDVQLAETSPIFSLIQAKKPITIAMTTDGLRVRFLKDNDVNFPTLATTPKDIFVHPILIAHLSNGKAGLELIGSLMKPAPLLVTQTVLRQSIASLFGPDISPSYELPILLRGQTTVQVAKSETGSALRIVIEGQVPRERNILERLKTLFTAELAAITTDDDLFDDKFSMKSVRQDNSLIEDTKREENGWTIESIHQKGTEKILLLGLRGSRYLLSNDAAAFEKGISMEAAALTPLSSIPAGLGLIDSNQMHTFLLQNLRTVWPSSLEIPSGTGGYLKWKMTQEGARITFLFKKV